MTKTQNSETPRPTCEVWLDANGVHQIKGKPRKGWRICGAESVVRESIWYEDGSHTDGMEKCGEHAHPGSVDALYGGQLRRAYRDMIPAIAEQMRQDRADELAAAGRITHDRYASREPATSCHTCEHCRTAFTASTTGRPPRFCSTRCRVAAHRAAKKISA